jgi:WD40 repeat protein
MAVDSSPEPDSHLLASVSYDRTVKLWAPEGVSEDGQDGDHEAMEL